MVTVGGFQKFELRIGSIVAAEPIPRTDRLLRVQVDVGAERRQVVAGIAAAYQPRELLGLQVVVLANVVPVTIRGVRSEGMLLGVGCGGTGEIALLTVNRPVSNGTQVQ